MRGALTLLGQSLPASVVSVQSSGIVTVKFELTAIPYTLPNITVPMAGSEYVRLPIQPGCLGWVLTADAYLGGVSGLGGGTADLTQRGNLSALVWSPIGNKNWTDTDDPRKLVLYGPDGAVLRTESGASAITVTETSITLRSASLVFDGPVTFKNSVTGESNTIDFGTTKIEAGDITSNGVNVGSTHVHDGVQTGGGNTGPPTP